MKTNFDFLSRGFDERQRLKERIVSVYDKAAPIYERVGPDITSHFNQLLIDRCGLFPGAQVLDVATGRGGVLLLAAEKVGPSGLVVGVDLSEQMLSECRSEPSVQNFDHVELYQMDAERLDIPEETFDFVTCGFALPIFPKNHVALREIKRVLKYTGVVGLSSWVQDCQHIEWLFDIFSKFCPSATKAQQQAYSNFCLAKELQRLLQEEGFEDIEIQEEEQTFVFLDKKEWWTKLWSTEFRGFLELMDEETLIDFEAFVFLQLDQFVENGNLRVPFSALTATARKPWN